MICQADALRIPLADESADCIVTSPPYWGLRDYGLNGSGIGLEPTLDEYIEHMRAVGRELWRVLKPEGTLWLNLGDCYAAQRAGWNHEPHTGTVPASARGEGAYGTFHKHNALRDARSIGLKHKDLVGLPWRVAFALQADGWYLRSDIIWHKPNPMPESVRDRPTKAHEYLFLMAKQQTYYYDGEAIREPHNDVHGGPERFGKIGSEGGYRESERTRDGGVRSTAIAKPGKREYNPAGRNRRSVWTIPTSPYKGAHFATFPAALVEPCILAGTKRGGIVLDPFCGSGTVGEVCRKHGRRFVGLDLSMKYLRELALPRAEGKQTAEAIARMPLFARPQPDSLRTETD